MVMVWDRRSCSLPRALTIVNVGSSCPFSETYRSMRRLSAIGEPQLCHFVGREQRRRLECENARDAKRLEADHQLVEHVTELVERHVLGQHLRGGVEHDSSRVHRA